jgi:hypothetical protein
MQYRLSDDNGNLSVLKVRHGYGDAFTVIGDVKDKDVINKSREKFQEITHQKTERRYQNVSNWQTLVDDALQKAGHKYVAPHKMRELCLKGKLIAYVRVKGYYKPQPYEIRRMTNAGFYTVEHGRKRLIKGQYVDHVEVKP